MHTAHFDKNSFDTSLINCMYIEKEAWNWIPCQQEHRIVCLARHIAPFGDGDRPWMSQVVHGQKSLVVTLRMPYLDARFASARQQQLARRVPSHVRYTVLQAVNTQETAVNWKVYERLKLFWISSWVGGKADVELRIFRKEFGPYKDWSAFGWEDVLGGGGIIEIRYFTGRYRRNRWWAGSNRL